MRFLELLLEKTAYDAMFRDFERLKISFPTTTVSMQVRNVRLALKRNDRIVWFLRLWRIGVLLQLETGLDRRADKIDKPDVVGDNPDPGAIQQLLTAYLREYKNASGLPRTDITTWASMFAGIRGKNNLGRLEHFISLPIPEIQNHVFRYDNPALILEQFAAAEKAWQDSRQGMIAQQEAEQDAEVILQFPNGFAWWKLDRAYCPHEAEAMGHCGNEPRAGSDDRLLSLRKPTKLNKQTFYMPYCTFVLQEDGGVLGEMKGRFNNSPKHAFEKGYSPSDFNDEIFALLKLPMIEDIAGGGYLPQENFKVADLREEQIEELGKLKPQLLPLSVQYKRHGVTPELIKKIIDRVREYRDITWDDKNKGFLWDYDVSMYKFIENHVETDRNRRQPMALWVLKTIEEGGDFDTDYHVDNTSKEELLNMLERRHPDVYTKLVARIEKRWEEEYPDEGEDDYRPDLAEMISDVDDDMDIMIQTAVSDGLRMGAEHAMYKDFQSWFEPLKEPGYRWIVLPQWDDKYYGSQVNTLIDAPTIISGLEDTDDDNWIEDGTEWMIDDMGDSDYGYSDYDEDAALERLVDELHFLDKESISNERP